MTTDKTPKETALEFWRGRRRVRVGGMAKGAGMIEPRLATMLAVFTTDAAVKRAALRRALARAVNASFNRISVDGCQSTNDSVLILANGASGVAIEEGSPAWPVFCRALEQAARTLALKIARDGEGATRFVTVRVTGAASDADARKAARAIANSALVKTSWFGGDPNWGRVMDAIGYSGATVREERVRIAYDGLAAVRRGQAANGVTEKQLARVLSKKAFTVAADLGLGRGRAVVYTCDCSLDYVRINSEYLT